MRSLLTLLFIALLCTCARAQVKALVGGTLIDGFGGKPIRNSVVLIEGDRIKAVGTRAEVKIPDGTEIISTEGMSVMPGMWDMHVHLMINGHSDYAYWDTVMPPFLPVPAVRAVPRNGRLPLGREVRRRSPRQGQ